jgi:catechol 2,3-dioxygenase-like lactoylglutathione lyase family enzyme
MSRTPLTLAFVSAVVLAFALAGAPHRSIGLAAQTPPARPKITGVAGIAIRTKDLAAARSFYSSILGLDEAFRVKNPLGGADFTTFKINEKQYVSVAPDLTNDADSRLLYVSFETTDARALRAYLASRGVAVPAAVTPDAQGNLSLMVKDPEGNRVEFLQFMPNSTHARSAGKFLSPRRLSTEALHVGYRIRDAAVMDTFYKDILGFRLMWKGGSNDTVFRWISMLVPDGTQWLEYMVDTTNPSPRTLGIWNHLAFGTLDQQAVAAQVIARGYMAAATPKIGRDGRWLMDLTDPDLTRVEFMIRKPVQTPCCSPLVDVIDGGRVGDPRLGLFEGHSDVGTASTIGGGSAVYDEVKRTYTISGGGENMWARADHFHYVWKQVQGDVTLSATIQFTGTTPAGTPDQHRKACLVLRQSLDADSIYADAAVHGNGMTALQWRNTTGDLSHDVETNIVGPARLKIEKRGQYVTMFVAKPGEPWRPSGGSTRVTFTGPFYVGLGVSAHNVDRIETATFADVDLATPAPVPAAPALVGTVETISLGSKDRRVVHVSMGTDAVEAVSWLPGATNTLAFNIGPRRVTVPADQPRAAPNLGGPLSPQPWNGTMPPATNDGKERSPDGQFLYFHSNRGGSMQIWRSRVDGTSPEQLTSEDQSNWYPHVSPDGKTMVFVTSAKGTSDRLANVDLTLRRMNLTDKTVDVLTAFFGGSGSLNGAPFAPTGQHLAFVSYQVAPK